MRRGCLSVSENKLSKEELKKAKEEMEKLKLEMARELGLFDKVMAGGWKNLTSKESGRIGGKISAKLRNKDAEKNKSKKN